MPRPEFVILGDATEIRCRTYTALLDMLQIPYVHVDYTQFLQGLPPLPTIEGTSIIRLFSPWYTQRVVDHFYDIGPTGPEARYDIHKGDAFYSRTPRTTYGFREFLARVRCVVNEHVETPWYVNPVHELYMGRDKAALYEWFDRCGIAYPRTWCGMSTVYEVLRHHERRPKRVLFVKLRSGSLGQGIAYLDRGRVHSTVGCKGGKFYSRRAVAIVDDHRDGYRVLQFLLDMGAVVQEGTRLPRVRGRHFDVRHYLTHGRLTLSVLRTNTELVTNTGVGGEIVWPKDLGQWVSTEQWAKLTSIGEWIGQQCESRDIAVDLGCDEESGEIHCFEVNFLPGRDIPAWMYSYEIQRNREHVAACV